MFKLFLILVLLIAAAWIGWEIHQDPGYVLINFHHWQIETTLWLTVLLILIAFIILYMLLRVIIISFRLPKSWRLKRYKDKEKQIQNEMELASCDLIEEQWQTAEHYFQRVIANSQRTLLAYMGAAIAAQAQSAHIRREQYLSKAFLSYPEAEITLAILQAKLQIQGNQMNEALQTLKKLQTSVPQHPAVKKLWIQIEQLSKS